jgi:hypothetical protein
MVNILLGPPGKSRRNTSVGLILSSGWDYTPQTSRILDKLSDFVFIILPGCEAANPLLIPLAGHELGHAVWEREGVAHSLQLDYSLRVTEFLIENADRFPGVTRDNDIDAPRTRERLETEKPQNLIYADACELVRRQLEEFFCDFVGLYLFGESFLHAFTYFLSPDFPAARSPKYPTVQTRLSQLSKAREKFAEEWGSNTYVDLPDLSAQFRERPVAPTEETPRASTLQRKLLSRGIDTISIGMTDQLIASLVAFGQRPTWRKLRNFNERQRVRIRDKSYRWAVPAEGAKSMGNILNAAWDVERNPAFWDTHPSLKRDFQTGDDPEKIRANTERRREALYELGLKNSEVLEYEYIISRPLPRD